MPHSIPSAEARLDPFHQPRRPLWMPPEMLSAPPLPLPPQGAAVARRHAVLVSPFYAKSPHGSFGKHVLAPTLALTSIASATPEGWTVRCWDENLLQGPPPSQPVPAVAGITVHLTFARRAYDLAAWYRSMGAKIILGGLHVQACADEAAALTYLASACLYKRSNRLWHFLIKHRLVHAVWRPLVELTRLRHVAFRKRLAREPQARSVRTAPCSTPFPASV